MLHGSLAAEVRPAGTRRVTTPARATLRLPTTRLRELTLARAARRLRRSTARTSAPGAERTPAALARLERHGRARTARRPRPRRRARDARCAIWRSCRLDRSARRTILRALPADRPGPVMAKGVEDTAFYRWSALIVARRGRRRPDEFGAPVERVPRVRPRGQADRWPAAPDDARRPTTPSAARTSGPGCAACRDPRRLGAAVRGCPAARGRLPRRRADGRVAALADARRRLAARRRPARRVPGEGDARGEAAHVAGPSPTSAYEERRERLRRARCLDGDIVAAFARVLERADGADRGHDSLASKLLQLTLPGVPDVYQGSELVGLRLVDPDNRARRRLPAPTAAVLGRALAGARPTRRGPRRRASCW